MAKAKYTRGEDGYFKTNDWTGEYKPDGTKKCGKAAPLRQSRHLFPMSVRGFEPQTT